MKKLLPIAAALSVMLASAASQATPLTYRLEAGSINASVWLNGTPIAFGRGVLDSGTAVFDPEVGALVDLTLGAQNLGVYASQLPGAFNWISVDVSLSMTGGASSGSGSNPYTLTIERIEGSFTGWIEDVNAPITLSPLPIDGNVLNQAVSAVARYNDDGSLDLLVRGVKLAEFQFGDDLFELRGDLKFFGVVAPEASLALLLGLGALSLAAKASHRR